MNKLITNQLEFEAMNYRREIDGLRALAVLAVLIFHFYPKHFHYGYLGVDLFFVISGFLISSYIIEENEDGRFSFSMFYIRRIKRILPVTMMVLASSSIVAANLFIATDFERFLKSLVATLFFFANIFFWRDGGYFGASDALKPLLHMWSLGVEEQFYLIFPLIYLLILKWITLPKWRLAAITSITLLSFLMTHLFLRIGGEGPAFFLTPFRVWQFGFGVMAAQIFRYYHSQHSQLSLVLSVLIIILGLSVFPDIVSPGFLVTFGAAIFLSRKYISVPVFSLFFSSALVQKIGLISFSLYLWHWPILVFINYITIDEPSPLIVGFGIFLTTSLSLLSYHFIEVPFRRRIPTSMALKFTATMIFLLLISSIFFLSTDYTRRGGGVALLVSEAAQTNYRCELSEYIKYGGSRACIINKELNGSYKVALVGNSHAQMYTPGIQGLLKIKGEKLLLIPLNGCLPTTNINISSECLKLARLNYEALAFDRNIKTVIFGLTWYQREWIGIDGKVVSDGSGMVLAKSLIDLVGKVKETGRDVYLIGPIQTPGYDLPSVLSRKIQFGHVPIHGIEGLLRVSRADFDAKFGEPIAWLRSQLGDRLILPSEELCDNEFCYYGDSGGVYFSDSNHLGKFGAEKMERLFRFLETK